MKLKIIILVMLGICYGIHAQPKLNHVTANKILQGCISYADSNSLKVAISVYDAGADLLAFMRMEGASLGACKVSHWKAISVATYRSSTEESAKWNVSNVPDLATIPGGLVIKSKEGVFLGAVGVSGAAAAVDVKCAEAGLRAAGF